ncbi:hypothetical protein LNQ52_32020 [Klebsiella pneumoniae subsp. pneumoniae]|nr:hypothetical protein [Klebsiella pneumoniae subsp. pneumoniae]
MPCQWRGRATNTLVVLRERSDRPHHVNFICDAFAMRGVPAGSGIPVSRSRRGDWRWRDYAWPDDLLRSFASGTGASLALNGAQLLVLPAAWVKGLRRKRSSPGDAGMAVHASSTTRYTWRQANAERAISGRAASSIPGWGPLSAGPDESRS